MIHSLRRGGAIAAFLGCALFSTSLLLARQGVVKTRDGRTLEGEIEERPDQVGVTIRGIRTVINRDNIEGQVEYFEGIEARYQAKVAQLPKKPTADDHLALARWLLDNKAYDLSLKEIDEAKKIDPNSAEAAQLESTVMGQRRLDRTRPAGTPGTVTTTTPPKNTGTPAGTTPPPATGEPGAAHFLTADDVNLIRQVEWRREDALAPRVSIPPDVRRRYIDFKAVPVTAFNSKKASEQAADIIRDGTPEMRKEVKVTTDPMAMAEFRRNIQPLVLNNCATAGCHGGHTAGRLYLFTSNADRDDVAYTNFYILQTYKQSFGDREYSMIDRTYPDHSILAQFALPAAISELDHPELKGQTLKPIAANRQAPAYKQITNWMKSLAAGEPRYDITYEPPVSSPPKPKPTKSDAADPAAKPGDPTKPATPATPATPKPAGAPPAAARPTPAGQ